MPVIMYKKIYPKTVLFYFFVLWGVTSLQTWGQTPTVSLTLDKTSISQAGGKATLTATLSAPHSRDVTVYLKTAGSAAYQGDYEADFVGKGTAKTVAGGNGRGSAANQLSSPRGIFVDSQGNLFISDTSNDRIQKVVYQPQIIIPAGQTSGTMTVTALADSVGEEDELAIFEILGIENGTVSPNQPVLQVIIGSLPPQPAAFTASKEVVCRSTSFTYTIPAVDRATSYKWSFTEATPNATIAATSSTSATVTFGAGFTGATLNVVASNAYGDSPKRSISIQVGSAPAQPGVISASNSVVCQGSSRTYSIASVSGASSYVWSYTGTGATFSSTGTSAQVTYGASVTGGEFRVQAVGACGTSTARTIAVSVIPQRPVLNGLLTIGRTQRRSEQATRSIILEPSVSKPITIEAGAVFSAQIVGCPN